MAEQKETFKSFVEKCAEDCNCNAETNTANQAKVLVSKLAEKLDSYSSKQITWDGIVGDRLTIESSNMSSVKVSDDVFTVDALIGATAIYVTNGEETSVELSEKDVLVADDGHIIISDGMTPVGLLFPSVNDDYETGTYFLYVSVQDYTLYTTSLKTKAKEIDVRIPAENIAMPKTITIVLDNDGNYSSNGTYEETLQNIERQNSVYYKETTATFYRVMTDFRYFGDNAIDIAFGNTSIIRIKSDNTIAACPPE